MRIECLTTFLHGRERYERGDVFTVEDDTGRYLVGNGWAKEVDGVIQSTTNESSADLVIQSSTIGTGDSNG